MHKLWRKPDGTPFYGGDMTSLEAKVQTITDWQGWVTGIIPDVLQLATNSGLHCFKRHFSHISFDLRPQTSAAKVFGVKNELGDPAQIEALLTQLGLVPVEAQEGN